MAKALIAVVIIALLTSCVTTRLENIPRSTYEWKHKTIDGNYQEVCRRIIGAAKCTSFMIDVEFYSTIGHGKSDIFEIRLFKIKSQPFCIIEARPQSESLTLVSVGMRNGANGINDREIWLKWAEEGGNCGPEHII